MPDTACDVRPPRHQAFTLIEMIGVLAVIAILAALLIPKVTSTINDASINSSAETFRTIQTAAAGHFCKYYFFNLTTNSSTIPAASLLTYDVSVLLPEGFLDQPLTMKVGKGSSLQVVAGGGNAGNGYRLDGTNNLTAANAYTVECVVSNVSAQDAWNMATRLDGSLANTTPVGTPQTVGRVVWTTNGTTANNLYMYVAGK